MQQIIKFALGIIFLVLGIPIGNFLAKKTKEELHSGKKWFKRLVILSLLGGLVGLIIENDVLMFTMFFIAIVTSRSLKNKNRKKKRKNRKK